MTEVIDDTVPSEYITHEPTAEEITTLKSIVVGSFKYPNRDLGEFKDDNSRFDEGAYAEACSDLETEIREDVADYFASRRLNPEIRLSEFEPEEIRAYF